MKRLIMLLVLVNSQHASALTDYRCVSDCTSRGYMYQVCVDRCSTNPQQQPPQQIQPVTPITPIKRIDYMCMNNCTQAGYQYAFCQSKCEY